MDNNYSDEQIQYFLANGGRLFRANNLLFIVEQTGLIIGPIHVENAAFFLTQNSTQEITMSGDNFKNPLQVLSSTAGLTIQNLVVDSRSQITFDIVADGQPQKGGHSLEYKTRDAFDSSTATIANNVVMLPSQPIAGSATLASGRTFLEVGAGISTSEHPAGHDFDLSGSQFYNLQQVEDALQNSATLAGLGLTAPAGKELRVRVGKLVGGVWTDDADCIITVNTVGETAIGVTIDIESDFSISYGSDTRSMDIVIETYSGDLGSASSADNFARAGDNIDYKGRYAILVDALTVRRARPQSFSKVTMLAAGAVPDASNYASLVAAGDELFPTQAAVFKQQDVKTFVFECQSAHNLDSGGVSLDPACVDSSAILKNIQSNTAPAGGRIHAPNIGGNAPSAGWATNQSGDNALTVLSETAFAIQMRMRDDQEINAYTLALITDSSEADFNVCQMSFNLAAGTFVATTLNIQLVSPELLTAHGGLVNCDFSGDGLPEGFGVSGHANESGAQEGTVSMHARPSSGASYDLAVSNIQVQNDDAMTVDLQSVQADVISYINGAAGRSVEDLLGSYTTTFTVTDMNGAQQSESLTQIRVQAKWPPEQQALGGSDGENLLREDSLNDPNMTSVDTIEIDLLRLRGHHDAGATSSYPLVNGQSAITEFAEHEIKLVKLDGSGNIAYDVSTTVQGDLITEVDSAGTDKPFILVTGVRAAKTGASFSDSSGIQQEAYKWELDCKVVSEAAMENTAAAPNGLEDVCTDPNYGGAKLAIAVRTLDALESDADSLTEWKVFPDAFEIMPANIEVTASSSELARSDTETISMGGDNFVPDADPAPAGYSWTVISDNEVAFSGFADNAAAQAMATVLGASMSPRIRDVGAGAGGGEIGLYGESYSVSGTTITITAADLGHSSMGIPSKVAFNGWAAGGPVELLS